MTESGLDPDQHVHVQTSVNVWFVCRIKYEKTNFRHVTNWSTDMCLCSAVVSCVSLLDNWTKTFLDCAPPPSPPNQSCFPTIMCRLCRYLLMQCVCTSVSVLQVRLAGSLLRPAAALRPHRPAPAVRSIITNPQKIKEQMEEAQPRNYWLLVSITAPPKNSPAHPAQ